MKRALALILVVFATLLALLTSPAYAQIELTEVDPPDGAMLDMPPTKISLCFSQPANLNEGVFRFRHPLPDDRILVLPVTVTPDEDGMCVEVTPGYPQDPPAGEYLLEWRVTAVEGEEEGSGTIRYQVPERVSPDETPSPTPPPSGDAQVRTGDDDDSDIFLIAVIAIAAVGGVAVLATLGYLLRKRIGFEPHRPPTDDDGDGGGH